MMGIVCHLPTISGKVLFKTNTDSYKVNPVEIEPDEHIIPIPFYGNRECRILKQLVKGHYSINILGVSARNQKLPKRVVPPSEINWFLIDSSEWTPVTRNHVREKYGLRNFECVPFRRNME